MRLVFTPHGWEDYQHWVQTDRATLTRINRLIDDALRDPFTGIGRPGQPVNSSLSDDAVLELWDRITTSIRLRPTSAAPQMPPGERVATGQADGAI